jgi:pimeloyl-ACP methyl ester carboxylesterase
MGGQNSWLGAEHPERVAGLIYLDAAFDYAAQQELEFDDPGPLLPPRPPAEPEDLRSYESLLQWMARTDTDPVPEGEMLALYNVNNRFLAGNAGVDMRLVDAIEAGVQRPRYEAITAPVLALFAIPDGPQYFISLGTTAAIRNLSKRLPPWPPASRNSRAPRAIVSLNSCPRQKSATCRRRP